MNVPEDMPIESKEIIKETGEENWKLDLDVQNEFETSNEDKNSSKEIRWRKEDDKKLFSTYRHLCRKSMLNLKDVVSVPLRKNKQHKQLIEAVGKEVGWKGKTSMLMKRI